MTGLAAPPLLHGLHHPAVFFVDQLAVELVHPGQQVGLLGLAEIG